MQIKQELRWKCWKISANNSGLHKTQKILLMIPLKEK